MRSAPGRGLREIYLYDPQELAKLPRHTRSAQLDPGEIAARCFEMFDEGHSTREIVIALRLTPYQVQVQHQEWLDGGGASLVISEIAKAALEEYVGPFQSVTELIERLREKLPKRTGDVMPLDRS
jgi:hypothetical protein